MKNILQRTPSKKMIQALIDIRKSEVTLHPQENFRYSLPGLYKRGYVDVLKITKDHKELFMVYLTDAGKLFLDLIKKDLKYGS